MMQDKHNALARRDFLKSAASVGLTIGLTSANPLFAIDAEPAATAKPKTPQVPTRKLGKTEIKVPALSFGTWLVDTNNQILLRRNLQYGIYYWDTAYNYGNGVAEIGIGKFLARNPKARKKLFLVTKASNAKTTKDIDERLATSLKRMNTDYIDLYYGVHQCDDPARLTDDLRKWAERAKEKELIRCFGITTHKNMIPVLQKAATLPWIDVVMTPYNFRYMQDKKMQAAIDACYKAKIGIIAMKVMGMGQKIETGADKKLIKSFLDRGFDEAQAKLKLVLQDKRIASACIGMKSVAVQNSNLAAVFDKQKLTRADCDAFRQFADATCSTYCKGCSHICSQALPEGTPVSSIMRYLMYHNSYGEQEEARKLFAQLPAEQKNRLLDLDYTLAERLCPQNIPIRELISEAVRKLT